MQASNNMQKNMILKPIGYPQGDYSEVIFRFAFRTSGIPGIGSLDLSNLYGWSAKRFLKPEGYSVRPPLPCGNQTWDCVEIPELATVVYSWKNQCMYIHIYATPPKTYILCIRYVLECLVFLLIFSPIVALHQESILGECAWTHL